MYVLSKLNLFTYYGHGMLLYSMLIVPSLFCQFELFVLPIWMFFMCSDMQTLSGLTVSLKHCAPHSHKIWYITFFVSNVKTHGVALLSKLPMVFQEWKSVHTLHLLTTLLMSSKIPQMYGIMAVLLVSLVSTQVVPWRTL